MPCIAVTLAPDFLKTRALLEPVDRLTCAFTERMQELQSFTSHRGCA